MKKRILGIMAIAMVAFVNLYLVSSDKTYNRLLAFNEMESLAKLEFNDYEGENWDVEYGKELRSFYCTSGNEYYKCVPGDTDDICHLMDETYCGAGDTPDDNNPVTPGVVNNNCTKLGHLFTYTPCFKTCSRCGLTVSLCED